MAHDPTSETKRARCPEAVLGWIPWYVDGGLSSREKGAVEAHAAECGECRTELDLVAGEPWALDGIELPDADRMFDEITARIDSEPRSGRATVIPISRGRALTAEEVTRLERWVLDPGSELDSGAESRSASEADRAEDRAAPSPSERAQIDQRSPRRIRFERAPVWAAAALVLLAVGGLGGALFEKLWSESATQAAADSADYQLASMTPAPDAQAAGPMIDVVFSDAASAREIWSTLRGLGVEIVAGPTNLGVYRLRLLPAATEDRAPTPADAAAIAARLVAADSSLAIFAEPVP